MTQETQVEIPEVRSTIEMTVGGITEALVEGVGEDQVEDEDEEEGAAAAAVVEDEPPC